MIYVRTSEDVGCNLGIISEKNTLRSLSHFFSQYLIDESVPRVRRAIAYRHRVE